jgi:hypothetical protein
MTDENNPAARVRAAGYVVDALNEPRGLGGGWDYAATDSEATLFGVAFQPDFDGWEYAEETRGAAQVIADRLNAARANQ